MKSLLAFRYLFGLLLAFVLIAALVCGVFLMLLLAKCYEWPNNFVGALLWFPFHTLYYQSAGKSTSI